MNKIEFPLGVELPLRGGGVAVLYEFHNGIWYGRMRFAEDNNYWHLDKWRPNGELFSHGLGPMADILPPKRRAWVVWVDGEAVAVVPTKDEALEAALRVEYQRNMRNDPRIQEITEP